MKKTLFVLLVLCSSVAFGQNFTFTYNADSATFGLPQQDLYVYGVIHKTNKGTPLDINVVRIRDVVVPGWLSAMCLDFCFADFVDSVQLNMADTLDNQPFDMVFYTNATPNHDYGTVRMSNAANPSEYIILNFYGRTDNTDLNDPKSYVSAMIY